MEEYLMKVRIIVLQKCMHFLSRLLDLIDYGSYKAVDQGMLTKRVVLALAKLYGLTEEVSL